MNGQRIQQMEHHFLFLIAQVTEKEFVCVCEFLMEYFSSLYLLKKNLFSNSVSTETVSFTLIFTFIEFGEKKEKSTKKKAFGMSYY